MLLREENMKVLVAYFSASGTTAAVAEAIAKENGAELFEIRPEKPYTDADLKWTNPLARCNWEKIGKKDVPVAGKVGFFAAYDLVFLGFPIWYYGAPNVIQTFCKGYDWTGKKLALFATSGGSDIGRTAERLKPYLSGDPEIVGAEVFSNSDDAIYWLMGSFTELTTHEIEYWNERADEPIRFEPVIMSEEEKAEFERKHPMPAPGEIEEILRKAIE